MEWGDEWGSWWGDAIAWGDREDSDGLVNDPDLPRLEIPAGELDTLRTADERVWKQFEGVEGQADVHAVLGDAAADLEHVAGQLLERQFVAFARGYWLEAIAQSIGLSRGGLTDDDLLRIAVIAETLSQVAECSAPETIELIARIAHEGADVIYSERYPMGFSAAVPDLTPERFQVMRQVLADAVASCYGAYLETYPSAVEPGEHGIGGWDFPGAPGFVAGTSDPPPQLREFAPQLLYHAPDFRTLADPISGGTGVLDGSTYDSATDSRVFNGTTNRVDYPNVVDLGDPPIAHSGVCWVRPTTLSGNPRHLFVAHDTVPQQSVMLRRNGVSFGFVHAYSVTTLTRFSASILTNNQWQMLGWSYDASGLSAGVRLYRNGAEVSYGSATNSSGTPRAADGTWSWGGRLDLDGEGFPGRIGRGRIYQGVLAPEAFRRIYVINILGGRVSPFGSWGFPGGGDDDARSLWSYAATLGS